MNIVELQAAYDDGTYHPRFWAWLAENEHVLTAFVRAAMELRAAGVKRWAAGAIIHYLRHETALRESSQAGVLKINQNCSSGLARLSMRLYPELIDFFEVRTREATKAKARKLDDGDLYAGAEA